MIISPSIASADLLHAAEEVRFICGHFPDLHVDIEDGVHLDNISFGFRLARMICEAATRPVSLHLMVNDPIHWIPDVQRCGAAVTFVHLDHLRDPAAALDAYRRAGIPVGLGLSSRDLHRGDWKALAAQTDAVLMLPCDIDDPAQRFVPELADFACELARHSGKRVWVDGAIDFPMLAGLEDAGVYAAVMGRAVFRDKVNACREAETWNPHI